MERKEIVADYSNNEERSPDHGLSTKHEKPMLYGGFWVRFLAFHVDVVILYIMRYPISLIFWLLSDEFTIYGGLRKGAGNIGLDVLYSFINIAFWFAYFTIFTSRKQATLGKMLFKLKVVREDMGNVPLARSFLRELFRFVSWIPCGLGLIWAAFDSRKQTWHDKLAKTLVVKSP